jgi:hypothetical protein
MEHGTVAARFYFVSPFPAVVSFALWIDGNHDFMPLLNGLEVARRVKDADGNTKVIFLTLDTDPA